MLSLLFIGLHESSFHSVLLLQDIPNITPGQSQPPPPEFNIPHISKADSPVRRVDGGPKGRPPPGGGDTALMALKGNVDASRSTESPASNSSTDEDAKGVLSKPQVRKLPVLCTWQSNANWLKDDCKK